MGIKRLISSVDQLGSKPHDIRAYKDNFAVVRKLLKKRMLHAFSQRSAALRVQLRPLRWQALGSVLGSAARARYIRARRSVLKNAFGNAP